MNKTKFISILIILVALITICLGIYLSKISNPKTITTKFIDTLATITKETLTPTQNIAFKDNYTVSSTITIESETTKDKTKLQRILRNLNNINANTKYIQNKKDKMLLFEINSTKDTNDLFSAKYLIENSTKYSSISNITNKYVNNGSNNYFEILNKETTELTNLIYIYDQIVLSLKENLKDEYFTTHYETTTINSIKDKYELITISLDQTQIIELSDAILSSLKKDQKSAIILETIFPNFKDYEIPKESLNNIENIKLNLYINNRYEIKKTQLILKNSNVTYNISYEFNANNSVGYLIEDGVLIYMFNLKDISGGKKINILNPTEKQIGQICIYQDSDKYELVIDLDDLKNNKIKGIFSSINSQADDQKSFNNNTTIDISINDLSQNNYTNLNININSVITDIYNIEEDLSTAILKSSLTEVEKNQIRAYLQNGLYKIFEYEEV